MNHASPSLNRRVAYSGGVAHRHLYYVTSGFPEHFVEAERYLCSRGLDEAIARTSAGNPLLKCMCGNILCSKFDPAWLFFTPHGSF
jgi:hypothetical protein